jgi:rhomboid protease GluP
VGASGAIMGLLAAASAASFRLPKGPERTRVHMLLMQMLLPSLIPIAWHQSGGQVDFASHLGGAITGVLAGVFLLKTWPAADPLPRFRGAALLLALAGAVFLAFGLVGVAGTHAEYVRRDSYASLLIPNAELIGEEEKLLAASEGFVTRYPRDPRGHFFRGVRLARDGELGLAEGELRTALGERELLEHYFDQRGLEIELRSVLAAILIQGGNQPEAVIAAAPVCSAGTDGQVPERLRPLHVCP